MHGAHSAKNAFGLSESPKPLLSLAKCRAILGSDSPESDADLSRLRDQLYGLARVVVEAVGPDQRRRHGPSHAPNAARRAFDGAAGVGARPADFSDALALLSDDERDEVEERAAIHEFDGGLDRSAAERAAFSENWRAKHGGGFQ
jgi:hypothetical protein